MAILTAGLWLGFVTFASDAPAGLTAVALSIILALYAYVALARVPNAADVAFRASIVALLTALALLIGYQALEAEFFIVAAPVVGAGAGIAHVVPPLGERVRTWLRLGLVLAAAAIASWVYGIDHTVYALVAPLLPFPAVLGGDRLHDRARDVLAEDSA